MGAKFWLRRKNAFRTSNNDEYRPFRCRWHSITDTYDLLGSEEAQNRFKILADGAALGLANPEKIEGWMRWLAELIQFKVNCSEAPKTFLYPQEFLDSPRHPLRASDALPLGKGRRMNGTTNRMFKGKTITIDRLFEASVVLCDRLDAGRSPEPSNPITEDKERSDRRSKWLKRAMEDKGWTSRSEVRTAGGPTYNTIRRWCSGQASNQDPSVKGMLAKAFGVKFGSVPD